MLLNLTTLLLQDLENSAGSWDLYGTEDERRYPGLQAEFFQRAAAPLRRREALLGFVGVGEHPSVLLLPHVGGFAFLDTSV